MSFFTIPGPIVICNFSARANRHRRYRHRQLSENKLTFSASISILYTRHDGQLLTKRMHTFIGVDVSCQSNIRRMQNWHWRWWGNPHAYIYQLIKGPSEGDAGFLFSIYCWCRPLEIPPLFSHERLLYSLSFMARLHLPHFLSFSWALSFTGAQPGSGWRGMPTARQT